MRAVRAWYLATQAGSWIDFVGIAQVVRVDGAADELVRGQVGLGEHYGHVGLLLHAYAMLPSDAAAVGYTTTNDLASKFLCAFLLPLDALIVKDQRVQVAVTGVEDIGD